VLRFVFALELEEPFLDGAGGGAEVGHGLKIGTATRGA
jgi:hypothetical protein